MADKSLFDIAKELYQGFGNNPANRELANTLTFRAPVVRELNPLVTIPRGIETLRNTDYGAVKDFLTGKYQIANDPKASMQRAGQASMNMFEGALDAAPVLGLVKPTIAGAKMAAPHLAEAGVRQLNKLEEKYGLPTSPTMNIIKPEGNLNFTTRLDEQIRGPETQTVFDLLKQVQGKPGVTKEGLKKIAQNYPDSAAKISKQEFKENIPASYYGKQDLKTNSEELFDNYLMEAMDHMDTADTFSNLGLPNRLHEDFDNIISGHTNFSEIDPQHQRLFARTFGVDPNTMTDDEIFDVLGQHYMDRRHEDAYEYAMDRAGSPTETGYSYQNFQRLVGDEVPGYFEFGVTHPEQMMKEATGEAKRYRHYSNDSMPAGLIGHVRGSHLQEPTMITGDVTTKPNSYLIEEIQSDAQKGEEQLGSLHQVHGTLLKSAVQDAAEKGADFVYVPTSYPIGKVRYKPNTDYASIYDNAIVKEGLDPLRKIPGIEINQVTGRHLMPNLDIADVPYFHEIKLTPEAREHILSGPGQSVPGYAAGGLVANEYNDEHIDRMSDEIMNFAKGGQVTGQPHENEYVKAAGKYSRKMQGMAASIVPGLRPILDKAQDLPLKYYAATGEHNGEADAMRHMLLQAQLMQKYGETPAKAIGWLHENISFGQPEREKTMDEYNDVLGRQIGAKAKSEQEMIDMARQYIDTKKAKSIKQDNSPDGYAEGGEVNTDLSKYGIDASQMQKLTDLSDSSQWLQKYQASKPVTSSPDLNQLAEYYKEQSTTPVAPVAQRVTTPAATPTVQSVTKAPMYTPHEGMTFGNDFYDRYAQNVGGQYADPYQNFLMTGARVIGPDNDIANLYKQYQASGRTDTPDWATLDTKGPITKLPVLSHKWDASGANPVDRLSSAWNPTTPLAEGVIVPEGYWDNYLAYNMNMSKAHPSLMQDGQIVSDAVLDNNKRALYAMSQGEYGNEGEIFNSYQSPRQTEQAIQNKNAEVSYTEKYYNDMKQRNIEHAQAYGYNYDSSDLDALLAKYKAEANAWFAATEARQQALTQQQINSAQYAEGGMVTGYARGGLVYNDAAISNLADQLLGA
jgi:hypothetical protein